MSYFSSIVLFRLLSVFFLVVERLNTMDRIGYYIITAHISVILTVILRVVQSIWFVYFSQVNAVNVVYVVIIVVLLPFPLFHTLMSHLCQLYTAVIILAKMFYQLHWIPEDFAQSNCTVCELFAVRSFTHFVLLYAVFQKKNRSLFDCF